jgi:hypothetical protein
MEDLGGLAEPSTERAACLIRTFPKHAAALLWSTREVAIAKPPRILS